MTVAEIISLISLLVVVAGSAYKVGYDAGQNSKKE